MEYVLGNLEDRYELELDKIVEKIQKSRVESPESKEFRVLLQLPDGLKPWGPVLVDYIEERVAQEGGREVSVMIWLGDCFGACDLPDSDCDLVVQFGHAEWS